MDTIGDLGTTALKSGLLETLHRFVGGTSEATKRTFEAAIPASMMAIAEGGSTTSGAQGLLDGMRSGKYPQLDAQDLGRTLADPRATSQLMASSGAFLEQILGGRMSGVLDSLSAYGGGDRSSASKLLALAAPLALGMIGRNARDENLDAEGLSSFLRAQKSRVAEMLPASMRTSFGIAATPELRPEVRSDLRSSNARSDARSDVRSDARRFDEVRGETTDVRREPAPEPRAEVRRFEELRRRPAGVTGRPVQRNWNGLLIALAALAVLGWLMARGVHRRQAEQGAGTPTQEQQQRPTGTTGGNGPQGNLGARASGTDAVASASRDLADRIVLIPA